MKIPINNMDLRQCLICLCKIETQYKSAFLERLEYSRELAINGIADAYKNGTFMALYGKENAISEMKKQLISDIIEKYEKEK